jgi:hypothetical protein
MINFITSDFSLDNGETAWMSEVIESENKKGGRSTF